MYIKYAFFCNFLIILCPNSYSVNFTNCTRSFIKINYFIYEVINRMPTKYFQKKLSNSDFFIPYYARIKRIAFFMSYVDS